MEGEAEGKQDGGELGKGMVGGLGAEGGKRVWEGGGEWRGGGGGWVGEGGGGVQFNRPSTPLFSNVTPYQLEPAINSRFLIYYCLHSRTDHKGIVFL